MRLSRKRQLDKPAAVGVKLSLESDMLEPSERPAVEQQLTIESALAAAAETPWDKGLVEPVLQSWVHSIDPLGTYEGSLIPHTETNRARRILFSPAVILRRRTARSLVRALSTVIEQIKAGTEMADQLDERVNPGILGQIWVVLQIPDLYRVKSETSNSKR